MEWLEDPDNSDLSVRSRADPIELENLWRSDPRCAPWHGSGLGVFQAFNTHRNHVAGQDASRFDRNMSKTLSNTSLKEDKKILKVLREVTRTSIGN